MAEHEWVPSRLSHGSKQCKHCLCTYEEAIAAIGMDCPILTKEPEGLKMIYFVLKPSSDSPYGAASRMAMRAYAKEIRPTNSNLARELDEWAARDAKAVRSDK